ncbi:carbonate dehydratase, eukaryotic-type [Ancylostoma duodenale]|uniref:carbonic anhydrase n=1 Tax=Ancylostoma duodenale TaxID=51022 RepID=A0A0C2GDI5_9BILA|nr:carbonate dehydratase, eukaryotic-type [Ancylostoma duodenale]
MIYQSIGQGVTLEKWIDCWQPVYNTGALLVQLFINWLSKAAAEERWRYDDQSHWTGTCAAGRSQSPVNLVLGEAEVVNFDSVKFNNYHLTGAVDVDNSVTVDGFLTWEQPPSITGGNLDTTYFLRQLHFHWNSEHTFNGLHYDAELHLVHISDKYDPNLNMSLSGSVAVVAVPFQVGDLEAAPDGIENLFVEENSTGSLTTPPCSEGVTWTVLAEPVLLTAEQLASLRGAQSQDDAAKVRNSRKIQSMNGRKLYLNKAARIFLEEDALSRVLIIFGLLVLLMIAPPLLILWVIYKKTTLPNPNLTTSSITTQQTEAPRAEGGFTRAELEVPREEPAIALQERPGPSEERTPSSGHGRIYEYLCVSPEEKVLPYHS